MMVLKELGDPGAQLQGGRFVLWWLEASLWCCEDPPAGATAVRAPQELQLRAPGKSDEGKQGTGTRKRDDVRHISG